MDRIYPYKEREWDKGGGRMKYDTCLIKTDSLDQILQLKYQLDEQGIPYREKIRSGSKRFWRSSVYNRTGQLWNKRRAANYL